MTSNHDINVDINIDIDKELCKESGKVSVSNDHDYFMQIAIKEAQLAFNKDEVPVGAIIVKDDNIIAKAHNKKESLNTSVAHAEILAIQKAEKKLGDWRLNGCVLYTTLEPCPMCAGVVLHSRIEACVYGAKDHKWGAHQSKIDLFQKKIFNHNVNAIYYPNQNCSELLTRFFKKKRI